MGTTRGVGQGPVRVAQRHGGECTLQSQMTPLSEPKTGKFTPLETLSQIQYYTLMKEPYGKRAKYHPTLNLITARRITFNPLGKKLQLTLLLYLRIIDVMMVVL